MLSRSWRAPWSNARPIRRALFFSLIDGLAATTAIGMVERFIVPYALELGFTRQQIGMLGSFPYLMASLSQLASPYIVGRQGRRKPLCVTAVFLNALWLLCLAAVWHVPTGLRSYATLAVFTLYAIFVSVQIGAWGSWMADLLPDRSRSRYFGWRDQVSGLFAMPAAYLVALLLDGFSHNPFVGFAIVFSIAAALRLISGISVAVMYEPPMRKEHGSVRAGFLRYLSGKGNRDVLYASLYSAAIMFATRLAGPFFAVYMREDLMLSYKSYTLLGLVASLTQLIFIKFWGYVGGRVGNARLIKLAWPGIVAIPLLWTISANFYYLIVLQMIAGFCWSATLLASWNYVLDASRPESRARYVSYSMIMTGVGGAAGAIMGGIIVPHLPPLWGYKIRTLFAISAGLRVVAGILTLGRLREVRRVARMGVNQLIYALPGVRPLVGVYRAVVRPIRRQ